MKNMTTRFLSIDFKQKIEASCSDDFSRSSMKRTTKVVTTTPILHIALVLFLTCVFFLHGSVGYAQDEEEREQPVTAYYSSSGTEWANLAAGEVGTGLILYYLPSRGVERPSLAVRLSKAGAEGSQEGTPEEVALAEVFDAPPGFDYVPVDIEGEQATLRASLTPIITIEALGGWWLRDHGDSGSQQVNYNLDIQINGPITAMWGAGYDEERGPVGWPELVQRGELVVSVIVRDPEGVGFPKWDLRFLEPPFRGYGFYRTNYAERKCESPTEVALGPSPLWPYVADAIKPKYELPTGSFRPPIIVNWERSQITHFSELVTVRHQNCSYSLYSLDRLALGEENQANFETPFAFYELSGEGVGYPNLLLRTERYPAKDPWGPIESDMETIRYSWRHGVGDWHWDYKIEVLGFYPYSDTTPIADGLLSIDAPSYEAFPQWVVEKEWPVITFIDIEGNGYVSSEGLYEWSPRAIGLAYAIGWVDAPEEEAFTTLRRGLRGEYRSQQSLTPKLYLSPIDNRLHLFAAEGGLWNLAGDVVLRLHNLDGGSYINGWTRERLPISVDAAPEGTPEEVIVEETSEEEEAPLAPVVIEEALYALDGHLLYSSPNEVILRQATYQPALVELLPPTDTATWRSFQAQVDPITSQRRDAEDIKSWLTDFAGQSVLITNARLFDLRATDEGFRFLLDLQPGFEVQQSDLFNTDRLSRGQYAITYDGQWQIEAVTAPELLLSIQVPQEQEQLSIEFEIPIQVIIQHNGTSDINGLQLMATMSQDSDSEPIEILRQELDLLSGEVTSIPLNWQPKAAGEWQLRFWLEDAEETVLLEQAQQVTIPSEAQADSTIILFLSTNAGKQSLAVILLLAFAMMMMWALFMADRS